MSTFWSIWIIVITVITLVFVFATLYLNSKNYTGIEEGESMGHEFDGIEELNNPLPKWWKYMYWATGVWAIFYLAFFPGLGNFEGFAGGWRSSNQDIRSIEESKAATKASEEAGIRVQYDREVKKADERFGPLFELLAKIDYPTETANIQALSDKELATISALNSKENKAQLNLYQNQEEGENKSFTEFDFKISEDRNEFAPLSEKLITAYNTQRGLEIGQRLFLQNCAQCHGSTAEGGEGFPNLADNDWLYGGSFAQIKETLLEGRKAVMPAWGASLGEQGIKDMTAYVLSLSGREAKEGSVAAGQAQFAMCSACHGPEGNGSLALGLPMGAPNLTDNIWLYGGSERAIQETLQHGRNGVMPAWKDILGEDKVHLISAYVKSLSDK